jgi:hypothetical protein
MLQEGRNTAQAVSGFPLLRPRFNPSLGHQGFVADEVALGHVFSEYFGFPCHSRLCGIVVRVSEIRVGFPALPDCS